MTFNKKVVILVFLGAALIFILSSCTPGNRTETSLSTYWDESQNIIQTNDLLRLQQKVPFTIVVPMYLPKTIPASEQPDYTFGPSPGSGTETMVKIVYNQLMSACSCSIIINEYSSPSIWSPNEDMEYLYLDISGIQVLESKGLTAVQVQGQPVDETTYYYGWNKNNVGFLVTLIAIDQLEARKVVESMIK